MVEPTRARRWKRRTQTRLDLTAVALTPYPDGCYPVEAVAMLAKIAATVEPTRHRMPVSELYRGVDLRGRIGAEQLVALSVEACFAYALPAAVFAPTATGACARRMALLRLPVWTIALSSREQTCRNLQFSYGVMPLLEATDPESWNEFVRGWIHDRGFPGEFALLIAGPSPRHAGANHRLELIEL